MGTPSVRLANVLACPSCRGALSIDENGARCEGCRQTYEYASHQALDLRLKRPKTVTIQFELGTPLPDDVSFTPLLPNPAPEVETLPEGLTVRLNETLMSYFPRAASGALALDIGAGGGIHRAACQHAGFEYVGVDIEDENATVLGDAHALPFRDESFDFLLSLATLEHLRHPTLATSEAFRVARPGATFLGSVSFLEPFHGDSYYHHTHLGTLNSLTSAGFEVTHVVPERGWTVLVAQGGMILFPRMPARLSRILVAPLDLIHRLWWATRRAYRPSYHASDDYRLLATTGAFYFVARKPLS